MFLLPGVGHCGGGNGPDQADYLTALENWRENGTGSESNTWHHGIGRSQRGYDTSLVPYPQVARYSGSGDTNDAKNFSCVAP